MLLPPIYPLIGASIQIRRKQLKLTQERFAKQLGISRASLASVETGRQKILVHQLYNFATGLGLKVTDLLPDPDDLGEIETKSDLPLPKHLKPRERRLVERLLEEVEGNITDERTDHGDTQSRKARAKTSR